MFFSSFFVQEVQQTLFCKDDKTKNDTNGLAANWIYDIKNNFVEVVILFEDICLNFVNNTFISFSLDFDHYST